MKVRVFFCKEPDPEFILRDDNLSKQALDTIYDLVWECEFKNILNVGRIWIKFRQEERPFGISLRKRRSHYKISIGDIIQLANDYYMVGQIGAKQIKMID
ncbi:MAG TPA: hypothetical protein VH796_08520 [Nitrososphaeraceae archaeon]|jgi:hypothetical protein